MEYTNRQLQKIYLEAFNNRISNVELLPIAKQLTMICRRMQYSSDDVYEAIKLLNEFKEQGILDKVDDELLNLFLYLRGYKSYLYPIRPNTKCESQGDMLDFIWAICSDKESLRELFKKEDYSVEGFKKYHYYADMVRFPRHGAFWRFWVNYTYPSYDMDGEAMKALSEYNSDLYEIALRVQECRKLLYRSDLNSRGREKIYDYLLTAPTYLYLEKENLNNDLGLIKEGMNLMIENPDEYLNSNTGSIEFSKNMLTTLAEKKGIQRDLVQ